MDFNTIILISSTVLIACIIFSNLSYRLGVPTLLVFLAIGMFIGSSRFGFISFTDSMTASNIGSFALAFILFTGGMETKWSSIKKTLVPGGILASFGVAATAFIVGAFSYKVTNLSLLESLLLGSIVSSTDAATVFSILKSRNLNLKGRLIPTLEFESGSNDPLAYMLTLTLLTAISGQQSSPSEIAVFLLKQFFIGAVLGYLFGRIIAFFLNNFRLKYNGLYYSALIALVYFTFSVVSILQGNGFLAMYISGIVLGNSRYFYKRNLMKFFNAQTWIMQISLFVVLGMFSRPESISLIFKEGLIISLFMIFMARPFIVFALISVFKYSFKEKILISWGGFRGAASIVFALIPFLYGLDSAEKIFDIVFFIVILSVIFQGSLFPALSKKLGLVDESGKTNSLIKSFNDYTDDMVGIFAKMKVSEHSNVIGYEIVDIEIPEDILIMSIHRGDSYITPNGSTIIEEGDVLFVTASDESSVETFKKKASLNLLAIEE